MIGVIVRAQQWFEGTCEGAGHTLELLLRSTATLPAFPRKFREIVSQTFRAIFGSMPVVLITAFFTGMIVALQSGYELAKFGQEATIGYIVGASMVREMGPVFTAIPLAGLMGSTYAAELGTMKVSEEVDALEVMSIDPVYYLVMPRMIALTLASVFLTIYSDVIGILGGGLVGQSILNVDFNLYLRNARDAVKLKDIYGGLLKAFVFGTAIAAVSCSQGLRAENGAAGVGQATMRAVVVSFICIVVFDYLLTWMMY